MRGCMESDALFQDTFVFFSEEFQKLRFFFFSRRFSSFWLFEVFSWNFPNIKIPEFQKRALLSFPLSLLTHPDAQILSVILITIYTYSNKTHKKRFVLIRVLQKQRI